MLKSLFDAFTILESLHDGIYLTDNEGKTLFVNSSYERMTGLEKEDVIGKNVVELEGQGMFSPITNPSVVKTGKSMTTIQTNKLGHKVVVTGYPVRSLDGSKIFGAITFVRDITILEQLKQEVEYQRTLIQRYREVEHLRGQQDRQVIIKSDIMARVIERAAKLAHVDTPVIIAGETGVGKEVIAKILHSKGPRKDRPMLNVNCAAIPENLVETEFFGYAPGAFTGALVRGKAGFFELADQGTLFLDEIGELPLPMQAKLLRVLQDQEVRRIGNSKTIRVDVRIIVATNRDLDAMAKEGQFRRDLLYRLRVATIEIPPLRRRVADIDPLIQYFLARYNAKYKRDVYFTEEALKVLRNYQWPGNVRELENLIQGLIVALPDGAIDVDDLPGFLSRRVFENVADNQLEEFISHDKLRLCNVMADVERKILLYTMEQSQGDVYKAAKALGCDRTTIQRKLKRYKIEY